MGDIADSHLEDMFGEECEYCGAVFPDECDVDCLTRMDEVEDGEIDFDE